jgi:hypothetical protein
VSLAGNWARNRVKYLTIMPSRREIVLSVLEDIIFGLLRQLEDGIHGCETASDEIAAASRGASKRIEIGLSRRDGTCVTIFSHCTAIGCFNYAVEVIGLCPGPRVRTARERWVSRIHPRGVGNPVFSLACKLASSASSICVMRQSLKVLSLPNGVSQFFNRSSPA